MQWDIDRRWLGIVLALLVLASFLSMRWFIAPPPRIAPLTAPISVVEVSAPLTGPAMSAHAGSLRITVAPSLTASADALSAELYTALAYVSARTGIEPAGPINVAVNDSPDCLLHGLAYTERREAHVFTCAALPASRAVAILAHELAHQLAHDYYGAAHLRADPILLEGWATWGAGHYWLGTQPSFRAYLGGQAPLPLVADHLGRPVAEMNTLYYQWASFVEYLLTTYGRESFDALYRSGAGAPGSADYVGVYGLDLATLEAQWRAWLRGDRR